MDRFQILKGVLPPPPSTKPAENPLKGSIPIDLDIFGEEYPGYLVFSHKDKKQGLIEFSFSGKLVQTSKLFQTPRDSWAALFHRKFHFHLSGGQVFHINVRNVTAWDRGDGEGPIL
jgi:hypothetical protein